MKTLPKFTLQGYKNFLNSVLEAGFQIKPISKLPAKQENCIYLRHDVDFSVVMSSRIAEIEHDQSISSTYFIMLTGPYNPFNHETASAIRRVKSFGHEIGLHYDLKDWPDDKNLAASKLDKEIKILESIAETEVRSIVMHEPSRGGKDLFATDVGKYINPTYYQNTESDLCYISDSCRAWRDDSLLKFINQEIPKKYLMLNTHPELWLSDFPCNRFTYLENQLAPAATKSIRDYFDIQVRHCWNTHQASVDGIGDED